LLTHREGHRNQSVVARLAESGIDVALREDKIRIAPHVYNSTADVEAALDVLTQAA